MTSAHQAQLLAQASILPAASQQQVSRDENITTVVAPLR